MKGSLSKAHRAGKVRPGGSRLNQTAPLRAVVRVWFEGDVRREGLECGHTIYAPKDFMGDTNASRRRCWQCAHEEGLVAILREALEAFLAAWGPIHAHPDWADPSVTRHSPLAVGITVAVALQARAALAATDPGVCPGGGGAGHTAGRELIAAALELSKYDDWSEPRVGCPQCDPEEPGDWNAARAAFGEAVSAYLRADRAGETGGVDEGRERAVIAFVRELAARPAERESAADRHMMECAFCDGREAYDGRGIAFEHAPDCPSVRARALIAALDAPA